MTDSLLWAAIQRRQELLKRQRPTLSLNLLSPDRRQAEIAAIAEFEQLDRAIVGELVRRDAPVDLYGCRFRLTADRASFVEVDPRSDKPIHLCDGKKKFSHRLLYQYPNQKD